MRVCACGWRDVPTFTAQKVGYRGIDPIGGHVWIGAGVADPRCPRCGATTTSLADSERS